MSSKQNIANRQRVHLSSGMLLTLFLLVGISETILAYFAFSRADDHEYFLSVANYGMSVVPDFDQELYDLKAKAVATVFYVLATPSRIFGGDELVHLLWLRVVSLMGFWFTFEWIIHFRAKDVDAALIRKARFNFYLFSLLYPGQLAWTASILRDGIATALLAAGLWSSNYRVLWWMTPILLISSISLRPEYTLIIFTVVLAFKNKNWIERLPRKKLILLLTVIGISLSTYFLRKDSSAFAQLAFSEADMAYPPVDGVFDAFGYMRVLTQALIDPIYLNNLSTAGAFPMAESVFFVILLLCGINVLKKQSGLLVALVMGVLVCLWIFAYFEMAVSGFSRHRLPLQMILLGLVASSKLFDGKKVSVK